MEPGKSMSKLSSQMTTGSYVLFGSDGNLSGIGAELMVGLCCPPRVMRPSRNWKCVVCIIHVDEPSLRNEDFKWVLQSETFYIQDKYPKNGAKEVEKHLIGLSPANISTRHQLNVCEEETAPCHIKVAAIIYYSNVSAIGIVQVDTDN